MSAKITTSHLERRAVVYVRQSSMHQVVHHRESTTRQYDLSGRAVSLGWTPGQVDVIDEDLGRSGATTEGRTGLSRLAEAVSRGRVGAVFALEVSRLARSSEDWQRLLRLCALAGVVVVDEHTVYDPSHGDDKLLLDLKGTMSEVELRWLALRLQGAMLSKARRGELRIHPPTGYVWTGSGMALDPDDAVRRAIEVVLARYQVEPSAYAVVRWARRTGLDFPARHYLAGGHSEVIWKPLGVSRMTDLIHNPTYTGAYVYGRRPLREALVDGEIRKVRPSRYDEEAWQVCIRDAHPAYITWEQWLANREKLRDNANRFGGAVKSAPREGPTMLSGLLVCGRCGHRMHPSYWGRGSQRFSYTCPGDRQRGGDGCWTVKGAPVDEAVEAAFLKAVVPEELELSLAVEKQTHRQSEALADQWKARIERAEYEARLAERRYKAVDPDNRVVARSLERDWEQRLRDVEEVRTAYEEARTNKVVELTPQDRARVRALARNLAAVWRATTTTHADRQAMLRLVIEAVALHPVDVPERSTRIHIQWKSGTNTELLIPRPDRHDAWRTPPASIDRLAALVGQGLHDEDVATRLNEEGMLPAPGRLWNQSSVNQARNARKIERVAPDRPRRTRLPDRFPDGRYSVAGLARAAGVSTHVVRRWMAKGRVSAERADFGSHRRIWCLEVDEATLQALRQPTPRKRHRKPRLPERREDGRYSVRGVAKHLGVCVGTVRRWQQLGLLDVTTEPYGPYPRVHWVQLDDDTVERLRKPNALGGRAHHQAPTSSDRGPSV